MRDLLMGRGGVGETAAEMGQASGCLSVQDQRNRGLYRNVTCDPGEGKGKPVESEKIFQILNSARKVDPGIFDRV